jgi:GNAT superfamily N-acetyltransferase
MKVRVLGKNRSCLSGLPVPDLGPLLPSGRVQTVVVEEDGRVIGTMTVALVPHIEATWIHPEHRNAGVARALRRKTWELAREGGAIWAFGSAGDARAERILGRLGGTALPLTFYLLPLSENACQERPRALQGPACEPAGRV